MSMISGMASSASQTAASSTSQKMAVSVLKLQQDQAKSQGAAETKLIESASQVRGHEPGKGQRVDVTG